MFEDGAIVDLFIEGWRRSGEQRFGYLMGRYMEFTDVPLGIRAVVSAIYEPPQVRVWVWLTCHMTRGCRYVAGIVWNCWRIHWTRKYRSWPVYWA